MGKTANGAVWLDPNKTTPFEFYQYWRNISDADVMKCIRMLTFLSLEEIAEMETWEDSRINEKKEILAYQASKRGGVLHCQDAGERTVLRGNAVLFSEGILHL